MSATALTLLLACWQAMRSLEWLNAWNDDAERARIMAEAVAKALRGKPAPTPAALRVEFDRGWRNVRIRKQFRGGATCGQLAERHGLSTRQIKRIVQGVTRTPQGGGE